MCQLLNISRASVYYTKKPKQRSNELEQKVIEIFKKSRNNYGSRKIKVELAKEGIIVSRRRIRKIMVSNGLVSTYTVKQFKVSKTKCNETAIKNELNREFNRDKIMDVVVSDLTYVNVAGKWHYICLIIDLYNREIIGYAAGRNKTAELVQQAIRTIPFDLSKINIFHTDRGSEFKNKMIDDVLQAFNIKRSLSNKGNPYDNAVAEAMYKVVKTEFAFNRTFQNLDELKLELFDYVNWYNNVRIHGSLNYQTPVAFRNMSL